MTSVTPLIAKGAKRARPFAMAVGLSALAAERDVEVVVVHTGDGTRTGEVAAMLDARVGTPRHTDLLVAVLTPADDATRVSGAVGDHRRHGGDAVVALVGRPGQRRRLERDLLAHPDVEMSVVLYLDALDVAGRRCLMERIVRVLGTRAVAAGRRHAALTPVAADILERGAARRAAIVAALPVNSGATMPILSVMQARLATDIGGLSGGRPGVRAAGQAAAVAVTAPLWRTFARRAIRAVPAAAPLVRGGVAYTVTRGVAALARRVAPSRKEPEREER